MLLEIGTAAILLLCLHTPAYVDGKQVAIKIVEEPTNYGMNAGYQQEEEASKLQMRINPSNFSGPPHLKRLAGRCFTKVFNSYKYEFCPFVNITQHEQSLRWNPYSGVLGVWQEWEIENNTFVAMVMSEGDSCGSVHRATRILLRCGEVSEIHSVSEPKTCNYEMIFHTPLVCHPHSLLVYPTLPRDLQLQWNNIEGHLQAEAITQQGYRNMLRRNVFDIAGYTIPESSKQKQAEAAKQKEQQAKDKEPTFDSLYQCQAGYTKLQEEIEGLRALLRVNGLHDQIPESPENRDAELGPDHENRNHYGDYNWMHEEYGHVPDDI